MQSSNKETEQVGPVQRVPPRKISLVRDIKEGSLFEVCGVRYRKIHSNDCRAYVRLAAKRHVVLKDGAEFEAESGCVNISPNTEVFLIDEEAEALI